MANPQKRAGRITAPPKMVEVIERWAWPHYAKMLLPRAEDRLKKMEDPQRRAHYGEEVFRRTQEVTEYLRIEARKARGGLRKEFPVDLRGWKYAHLAEKLPEWHYRHGALAPIDVILEPQVIRSLNDKGFSGLWQPAVNLLRLRLPVSYDVEQARRFLRRVLVHELIHFAQSVMEKALHPKAGLPAKKIRTGPTEEHDLMDTEFFNEISDSFHRFLERGFENPREAAKVWVHAAPAYPGTVRDPFFKLLLKENPGKWKQAAKIFIEMLKEQ